MIHIKYVAGHTQVNAMLEGVAYSVKAWEKTLNLMLFMSELRTSLKQQLNQNADETNVHFYSYSVNFLFRNIWACWSEGHCSCISFMTFNQLLTPLMLNSIQWLNRIQWSLQIRELSLIWPLFTKVANMEILRSPLQKGNKKGLDLNMSELRLLNAARINITDPCSHNKSTTTVTSIWGPQTFAIGLRGLRRNVDSTLYANYNCCRFCLFQWKSLYKLVVIVILCELVAWAWRARNSENHVFIERFWSSFVVFSFIWSASSFSSVKVDSSLAIWKFR